MIDNAPVAEDLRIRRTRHALRNALMELASTKTFQAISIQDICSLAEVNRTTFYYHFPDKYALLQYSIREWFKDAYQAQMPIDSDWHWSSDNLRHLMLITFEAMDDFRAHCKIDGQREFAFVQSVVTEVLADILFRLFSRDNSINVLQHTSPELAASVVSWAIYGAGVYRGQDKRRESAAVFIDKVLPILMNGLA